MAPSALVRLGRERRSRWYVTHMKRLIACSPLALDSTACAGSLVINSSDEIAKLNQCSTFDGNVSVATNGVDNIALNGVKEITGFMSIADSSTVTSITSSTLQSLSALSLVNLPNLSTLTLPALTNFSKLGFQGLASLKSCEIATAGLQQDVSEISIIGTVIEKLDWLSWPVATTLTLANNFNLTDFTLPYEKIGGGSSYQISGNIRLANLDFSQLTGIAGSLAVSGNKDPTLNFDKLEAIDGYVKLNGPFSNITMPRLVSINGALNAQSTVDIISFCNWLSVQNQLYGHYDCTANNTNPLAAVTSSVSKAPLNTPTATTVATASGSSDPGQTSDLSTGAIIGIAMAMVVLISVVLTSLALLFFRRRSQKKKAQRAQQEEQAQAPAADEKKTHSTSTLGEELDASGTRYELGGGRTTHELPEAPPVTELDGHTYQEMDVEKPYFRDQKPAPDSPAGRFELP